MTNTEIVNHGLGKIGGAGDQINGAAFISDITDTDKVTLWCAANLPRARVYSIIRLAQLKAPFRECTKFYDCGAELDADDLPEIGQWTYAFNLPADCLAVVRQFYESYISWRDQLEYQVNFDVVPNAGQDGLILLTDAYTNVLSDDTTTSSAFIEYCFNQTNTGIYSEALIECIATKLAADVCPVIGKDAAERRRMLLEFERISIPNAAAYNHAMRNIHAGIKSDFRGGRNSTLHTL